MKNKSQNKLKELNFADLFPAKPAIWTILHELPVSSLYFRHCEVGVDPWQVWACLVRHLPQKIYIFFCQFCQFGAFVLVPEAR